MKKIESEPRAQNGKVDYERAFKMYDKKYPHIPERIDLDESNFLKHIKPEYRDEMRGSYIEASFFNPDGYPAHLNLFLEDGTDVGYISFYFYPIFRNEQEKKDKVMLLGIEKTQVNKDDFKDRGVATLLQAIIFKYYPNLYGVQATLGMDNLDAYKKAVDEGQDEYEAFKATPAYKIKSKFGFTSVDQEKSFPSRGILVSTRPD